MHFLQCFTQDSGACLCTQEPSLIQNSMLLVCCRYRGKAQRTVAAFTQRLQEVALAMPQMCCALYLQALGQPRQVPNHPQWTPCSLPALQQSCNAIHLTTDTWAILCLKVSNEAKMTCKYASKYMLQNRIQVRLYSLKVTTPYAFLPHCTMD